MPQLMVVTAMNHPRSVRSLNTANEKAQRFLNGDPENIPWPDSDSVFEATVSSIISATSKGFDFDVVFDDDREVKLSCYTFLDEIAQELRDWSLG
ncbi:hypothetical protein ROHU_010661 [Labeo rohita]|uniref:Uncharacterized protein n=1 Tax=Labeo rohita TaxID=84645 RepID=A0A498LUT9_LABRO|nr:hypothetical protein ROHU_010661 [Labeo rohita]